MKTLALAACLSLLAFVPVASAQDPSGMTLDAESAGTVPYEGSGTITYSLDIGCAEVAANPGTDEVTITVTDAPEWFNYTAAPFSIDPSACVLGSGRIQDTGTVEFTVSASAPAVLPHTVTLQAALGEVTATATSSFTVAYNSDYSLVPSVQFPLTVTNKTTTFTVTGTQASNAPSMIMVDGFSASNGALVSGIGALQYLNDAGKPDTKTYTVVFTAPAGKDWESANITLRVYGHYNFPDGSAAGDPMDHKNFTWEIRNGVVKAEGKSGGKDSPAPVGVVTALGLLAFAGLRRRKA